jgi:prepilin-type N-terminal cleavage/methylation domain-containing protein
VRRGFSLIETLIAMGLMTIAGIGLAHLAVISVRVNQSARTTTIATLLATEKMEALRALAWPELGLSPPGALFENTTGFFDTPHPDFVRRWSIETLSPGNIRVIQVSVTHASTRDVHDSSRRRPDESRMVDVRTRATP